MEEFLAGRRAVSQYIFVRDPEKLKEPLPLIRILGLAENDLSETAKGILKILEGELPAEESHEEWRDFKRQLLAYISVQDGLGVPVHTFTDSRSIFEIWYFYYEAKFLLTESIVCGLNGFYAAANALLRPFLEFSVLQNYYLRLITNSRSFSDLERYFRSHIHPNWNTALRSCLPDDDLAKDVRALIELYLKGLSESASHPYDPERSPQRGTGQGSGPTLVGLFFWQRTRLVLKAVLWAYYANLPLLFHPRALREKFGYNPPAGMLVDEACGEIIRQSLTEDDLDLFFDYSSRQQIVSDLSSWYESLPTLSETEIIKTWDEAGDGPYPGPGQAYALLFAKMRALRQSMALRNVRQISDKAEAAEDILSSLKKWKVAYKGIRHSKRR